MKPEEKQAMLERIDSLEEKIVKLEEELEAHEQLKHSVGDTIDIRVEAEIIDADPEDGDQTYQVRVYGHEFWIYNDDIVADEHELEDEAEDAPCRPVIGNVVIVRINGGEEHRNATILNICRHTGLVLVEYHGNITASGEKEWVCRSILMNS